jgi:hypothetical protein
MQHITKSFRFFSVFISINERTAQTAGAILMVNGSKDVVWRKDVPFGGQNNIVEGLGVKSPKTHNFLAVMGNSHYKVAKRQSAITFEPINGKTENFRIHDLRYRKLKILETGS